MSGVRRLIADGKYELLRVIGEGGMGTVHLARHVALDRQVAIKVLSPAAMHRADAADRFLKEARLVSQLRHQSTVQLLDFGTDGREYWLVMEHLEGKDLASILDRQKTLPLARALNVVTQLLAALGEAHDLGIVHCDLKPANIMVIPWQDDDGLPTELVKVLDFGIATLAADSKPSNEVAGTPPYMSPEQLQGLGVDARSDLYGVGVILHELLTGAPPFDEPDLIATMTAHLERDPPPLRSLSPELPTALEACVLTALAKSPVARFPHARAFRSRLLEIADAHATPIRRPTTTDLTARALSPVAAPQALARGGRAFVLWAVVGAALLASAAALVLVLRGGERDASERLPVDRPTVPAVATAAPPPPAPTSETPEPAPSADAALEAAPDVGTVRPDVEASPADAEASRADAEASPSDAEAAPSDDARTEGPIATAGKPRETPAPAVTAPTSPRPSRVSATAPTRPTSTPPAEPTPAPALAATPAPPTPAPEPPSPSPETPSTVATAPVAPPKPTEPATRAALAARAAVIDLDVDGSLPRSSVQRALDSARSALEVCYREGAEAAGRDAAASLTLAFAVNIDGQLRDVTVASFELPGVSACAAATIGRLRTRDRPDTGTVTGRARLRFAPLPPVPVP